jgi:hypothetical protein
MCTLVLSHTYLYNSSLFWGQYQEYLTGQGSENGLTFWHCYDFGFQCFIPCPVNIKTSLNFTDFTQFCTEKTNIKASVMNCFEQNTQLKVRENIIYIFYYFKTCFVDLCLSFLLVIVLLCVIHENIWKNQFLTQVFQLLSYWI